MIANDRSNSFLGQLRPQRVKFCYFFPLQKSQQEVQDPQTPTKSPTNNLKSHKSNQNPINIVTKSWQKSSCPSTAVDTNSGCNSFFSISIELTIIQRKYLDDYVFIKNLGKGTYGRVQKLRCKLDKEIYASKTLLKTASSSTNRYKNKKLQDEIRIYSKLSHPNIPMLYQIYTWKNQYTLILQYASGYNLHDVCRDHPNDQEKVARIMYQIFDTLEYLHTLNIVHHDIKPENIIYDQNSGLVQIFDFGEAVQLDSSQQKIMNQGGTLAYFAPECLQGITNTKNDMWASGVILYYLLSRIIYFYDYQKTQMRKNILEKPVIFQGNYWSERQKSVQDLILKLLQRDPAKRISAKQAKKHEWIVQNTKNWENPSHKVSREVFQTAKRSFSIDKQIKDKKIRAICSDGRSNGRNENHNKKSGFSESVQMTFSRR